MSDYEKELKELEKDPDFIIEGLKIENGELQIENTELRAEVEMLKKRKRFICAHEDCDRSFIIPLNHVEHVTMCPYCGCEDFWEYDKEVNVGGEA